MNVYASSSDKKSTGFTANKEISQQSQTPVQRKENRTGLPDNLKAGIEKLSGLSMNDVQVHYNSGKPTQLQAHAYAQGTDIHIAPGQERHLPHEAWHVVQQKQGRVKPTVQMESIPGNGDKKIGFLGHTASDHKNQAQVQTDILKKPSVSFSETVQLAPKKKSTQARAESKEVRRGRVAEEKKVAAAAPTSEVVPNKGHDYCNNVAQSLNDIFDATAFLGGFDFFNDAVRKNIQTINNKRSSCCVHRDFPDDDVNSLEYGIYKENLKDAVLAVFYLVIDDDPHHARSHISEPWQELLRLLSQLPEIAIDHRITDQDFDEGSARRHAVTAMETINNALNSLMEALISRFRELINARMGDNTV